MSERTERNCNKCIHHTSGNCDSWNCKMQTVEDVKKEAVNEYEKAVVEKLEERTDFLKNCTKYGNKNAEQQEKSYSTMMMYEVADLVDDLIEIVKQGGLSDDACEWKQDSMCEKVYRVCGGCFTSVYQKDFKYCPYCGKKIKVVE